MRVQIENRPANEIIRLYDDKIRFLLRSAVCPTILGRTKRHTDTR